MIAYGHFIWVNGSQLPLYFLRVFLLVTVFFSACSKNPRPKGILSEQEMVKILTEVYIHEEKVSRLGLKHDSAILVTDQFKRKIFEEAGTTDSVFKRSINYYWDQPKEMERIYDIMIDSLNLREQKMSVPQVQ